VAGVHALVLPDHLLRADPVSGLDKIGPIGVRQGREECWEHAGPSVTILDISKRNFRANRDRLQRDGNMFPAVGANVQVKMNI